jgi:molecular chaperone IbpA
MTRTRTLSTVNLPSFYKELGRATVGFDRMFNDLERTFANSQNNGYPPYNIVQVTDDEFTVTIAVAGFSMDELEVTKDKNVLRIEGKPLGNTDDVNYVHKGIAGRSFCREWRLADHVEVSSASLELGMLNVKLVRQVPEELQPKKIAIEEV